MRDMGMVLELQRRGEIEGFTPVQMVKVKFKAGRQAKQQPREDLTASSE